MSQQIRPKTTYGGDASRTRPRMILAEDDDDSLDALQSIFSSEGFEVTCAHDGEELVQVLEAARDSSLLPYIVVTDHGMAGYTGTEVTRGLRDNGWPVPIIIITGFGDDVRDLGYDAGADAVFTKPLNLDDLRTAVWYWVESRSGGLVSRQ